MTTTLMAMTSTPTSFRSSSSSTNPKPTLHCSLSPSPISRPKAPNFRPSKSIPVLGISNFSPWNGLSHLGISVKPPSLKLVRKGRSRRRGAAYASLFGVGAPEALVIGVVALLVFGPKGLAEVARNLGKTLRAFQPTIRELQDVSREFKSTLEREIGLDDISSPSQNMYSSNRTNITPTPTIAKTEDSQTMDDPNGVSPPKEAYTTEEYLKITEEQLKAVATEQLGEASQPQEGALREAYTAKEYLKVTEERLKVVEQPLSPPQAKEVQETAAAMPPSQDPESSP